MNDIGTTDVLREASALLQSKHGFRVSVTKRVLDRLVAQYVQITPTRWMSRRYAMWSPEMPGIVADVLARELEAKFEAGAR